MRRRTRAITLLLTATAAAALAWGWIHFTTPPSPRERLEEMRGQLQTLRAEADSCRAAVADEERAFKTYNRALDSLRSRISRYEALDPRGVPADSYAAYIDQFQRYNRGVTRWEAASESLQAHWQACRAIARALGLWSDSAPDSVVLAP